MHAKRWITALVLLPLLILLIIKGGTVLFAVLISLVCVLSLWEYFTIVFNTAPESGEGDRIQTPLPTIAGIKSSSEIGFQLLAIMLGPAIVWCAYFDSIRMILMLLVLNLILAALISLPQFKVSSSVTDRVTKQVFGMVYIPLLLSFLVLIRNSANGIVWIFFLLLIVFAGDTAAFYVGTYFGKHKLCPSISPGKTVEGSLGGIAANLCVGAFFMRLFLSSESWGAGIFFFLAAGAAGQLGDLVESVFKRAGNIKDSGGILPGHGGILDRIDALLFAAPVAYFFKEFVF